MHLKEVAKTLSFRKSGSSRYGESSILAESLSSQSMKFTKYEDLRKSMRMEGFVMDGHQPERAPRSGSSRWSSKLRSISLNGRKTTSRFSFDVLQMKEEEAKVKVKKKSSWLPDPCRRWPVQGW